MARGTRFAMLLASTAVLMRACRSGVGFMRNRFALAAIVAITAVGCPRSHDVLGRPTDGAVPSDASTVDASVPTDAATSDAGAVEDAAIAECVPGAMDCLGRVPRVCDESGHWSPGVHCPEQCYQGMCVPCVPNSFYCPQTTPYSYEVCSSTYAWVSTACATNPCFCIVESPTDCTYTGVDCGLASDGFGSLVDCDREIGGCPGGFVCGTDAEAGRCVPASAGATLECTPGSFDCGGVVERRCSRAGKWLPLLPGEPCGTPAECIAHFDECGIADVPDAGTVDCGACPSGYACGLHSANRCAPLLP